MTIAKELSSMKLEDYLTKHNMSLKELFELQKGTPSTNLEEEYIDVKGCNIIKRINKKRIILATLRTEIEAINIYQVLMYKLENNKYNNILIDDDKIRIQVVKDNQIKDFGTYIHKETAIMVSAKLDEYGWSKDNIPKIWYELGLINETTRTENSEYCFRTKSGTWQVQKKFQNISIYYGTYSSKKKAKFVVNELKKVNWDKSYLEEISEKYIY